MAEKVNLQQKIQAYRQSNPKLKKLSDNQVLSIMVQNGVISLTKEEQRSVFGNNIPQNNNMGLQVEKTAKKTNPEKTIYLQSGRKVVYSKTPDGKLVMKYYGTDGTQLKPDYFEKVEGQISISEDGNTYTITKNGKKETLQAKDPSKGAIDQNLVRLNNEEKRLKKTKKEQGFIGKSWDWIKNTTGIGDGSDKAQKQIEAERKLLNQIKTGKISKKDFKEVTGVEYSKENLEKFKQGELSQATAKIDGYKEGQEMASDVAGDMISGIAAVGIYTAAVAAAPFTGGASIAVGVVAAGASAAAIKTGIKYADAKSGGREYTADNLKKDLATGAFSGVLAPITGGMGGAVGKTVATKMGVQAVKQVGKEVAEEAVEQTAKGFVKTMLTNPTGYEYIGGNMVKRGLAFAAEAATDGAIGGAVDNAFRTAYDGGSLEDIGNSAVEGFVGGAIMSPVIGGGMKVAGKGAQKIFGKNNVDIDANGNRVRVNDDGTVVRIDENGNEIPASATDAEIHIPKGRFASDMEITETFKNIIYKNREKFKTLSAIQDQREFLEHSYKIFLEEMCIDESIAPKLVFGAEHPNARAYYSDTNNTLNIIDKNFPKDKSMGLGIIAHELKHFLQFKDELLTYTDDSMDGFMNLIDAKAHDVLRQHPEINYDEAFDKILSNFLDSNGKLKPHIQAIISSETPISPDSPKGQLVKKYLENEACYIDKTESLSIDGTLKSYENQVVELEAYSVGDVVATTFNKEILGIDKPIYTKETASINSRLATASSREEFVAIRDEIKSMPTGAEKTALQQEYLRKYNEFSRKYNEEFDIRMEYKPEEQTSINIKKLKIEKASDEDLKEIQKIDLEAFEGKYTIESDFDAYKADLVNQEITTYAIKGEDGKVIGYYQLEPVKNGELYIHSIGVRSNLRNTKASYAALKQMQDNITKLAQENNIEKVVLDVDADNSALVKLYKKFGFEVTDETSGVEAGHQYHDYRMEVQVKKNNTTLDNKDLSIVTKLEGMTWINDNGQEVQRFEDFEIKELVEAFKKNPKLVTKLVDATMFNDKGQEVPRFNYSEIKDLVEASKENPEAVTKLVNMTWINANGHEVPRFYTYEIKELVETFKENPELVTKLAGMTLIDSNGQKVPRFDDLEIIGLVEAYKKNLALVTKLVDATIFNDNNQEVPRFDYWEIIDLLKASKENPELVKRSWENEDIPLSGQLFIDFLQLSENDYKKIKNIIIYFDKNINSLKHQDMDVTRNMVAELIIENKESVLNIINLIGEPALRHAMGLRYKGLKQLLENATSLSNLDEETKITLRNKLNELPHPEQKLAKLEIISALANNLDKTVITKILDEIKAPQMTKEQKELADRIFVSDKSYTEQIEDFIREFNVPEERQDLIRKFLLEQKLSEKYVTPPSIDEQIAIMDKKIQSIQRNDKIPADTKQAYLNQLERQKAEILANPEQYTQARINDRAMKPLEAQVEAHINLPNQNNAFTKALNKEIYNILKIDPTEELLTDVTYDSKYVSRMFAGMSDSNFRRNFNELINMIKENPNRKFTDIIQEIPENIVTRKLFEENGLDFDKWIKFNEDSYEPFVVTVDVDKSVSAAKQNLKNELNSELAKRLDQNQIAKINQILVKNGFETAGQKDLPKIIKLIEKELDTGEYWKQNTPEINTFKDHIQIHKKNIHDVKQLKNTTEELHVRLWDKGDVGRNIFFGNHVGCCTSVGNFNSFAAPQHLMNAFVNGIEIVDKAGNSMGNSMCYFAKVDGKLTFVIDSFEANGKLGSAPEVTDAIIEYAKKVCAEMGQPDANVMFGPNYNKIDFSRCIRTKWHTIEIIGRAPENTYIDCIGGRGNINYVASERPMYEIMDL